MKETMQDLAIQIDWIHDKRTLPDWKDNRHNINVHSFYWIHEGKGTFWTEKEISVEAGSLFYLQPGLHMEMESHPHYPLRITMVLISLFRTSKATPEQMELSPLGPLPLPFMLQPGGELADQYEDLFKRLTRLWVPGQFASDLRTKALLYELLYKMLQTNESAKADRGLGYDLFLQVKDELERNYDEPLRFLELAERYKISTSYLRSLFQQYLHKSPKAYLSEIRHEHAKKQLLYTSLNMKEIARSCGYSDEFHFSKSFKQHSGVPPTALRHS